MKGLACRERSDRVTEATVTVSMKRPSVKACCQVNRTLAHYQAIRVTSSTKRLRV